VGVELGHEKVSGEERAGGECDLRHVTAVTSRSQKARSLGIGLYRLARLNGFA
jgi:hypothetical protein